MMEHKMCDVKMCCGACCRFSTKLVLSSWYERRIMGEQQELVCLSKRFSDFTFNLPFKLWWLYDYWACL